LFYGRKRFSLEQVRSIHLPKGVVLLGRKVTVFSDLSGKEADEDQFGRLVIRSHPDLDKLAKSGSTSKLLADAPRASGGRRASGEEINYATLEHAGRPHRGRISPEEQAFVREHLAEVNDRLRAEGKRLIDPSNKEHKDQYGL
jgi:hypothetical protein